MHAASGQRIQSRGQRGDQRLAFTGLHFRDFAVVQHHAADELDIEMAHVEEAAARFADYGKCRDDRRNQSLAHGLAKGGLGWVKFLKLLLNRLFQRLEARLKVVITEDLNFGLVLIDSCHGRLQLLDVALVLGANKLRNDPV